MEQGANFTLPFDALTAKGYATIRTFGDQYIGQLHVGNDYHEFARNSIMEAAMAIRNHCRTNDIAVSEITVADENGNTEKTA